ncbi:hypothetical protein A1O3_02018 [Capronia epimyces CBS 606.96]|uniref:Uncharacterized protein n=1 Tax=Capronia epimyces CBS 606.96 TaxID=1182542 RepID=W9Z381_9EURO|nr:uncharacterized protein A1O3_02018 [Capronia epimyces CBS 606.96]EXJ88954.1 hypothetical protein A1O3_02018 [Capronia epimyces CBS 606.96]
MAAFANSFIGLPGVNSVGYAGNVAYGFSLTTSELQEQLGLLGPINSICTSVDILTLEISDATCPPTVITTPQCNVNVGFCALESMADAGITSGTCTNGIFPCTSDQVIAKAINSCNALGAACQAYGNNGLTPLTASVSVAQIEENIATYALANTCLVGTTVTLSDASC